MNLSAADAAEVPPAVTTVTYTVPADSAGLVAVSCVPAALTTTLLAAVLPKSTALALFRFVPTIVTEAPPAVGPAVGLRLVTVGAGTKYVNWSLDDVAEVPPAVTTVTYTMPADPAGLVAVSCVPAALMTTLLAAALPKFTVLALVRFVPVTVTEAPPVVGPDLGLMPVTVGAGT